MIAHFIICETILGWIKLFVHPNWLVEQVSSGLDIVLLIRFISSLVSDVSI